MPANLKEVRGRIKSVVNTQQITKAMKMVSAAKLRRAQDAILEMRPYANHLGDILKNIFASIEGEEISLDFSSQREPNKVLLVLITSDKGLAGAFNSNLIKLARRTMLEKYREQYNAGNLYLMTVGKKGADYYKRLEDTNLLTNYRDLFLDLSFANVAEAAEFVMQSFLDKKFDRVELIYSRFKNAATQEYTLERYLPVALDASDDEEKKSHRADFIYEPDKKQIIEELIPKILKTQFFKALLESNASEHGARMTAMDQATENANELLRDLRIMYNRARQAAITTELTEIVSGAGALEEG